MSEEKTRYTDEELEEFKKLILEKLEQAQKSYDDYSEQLRNRDGSLIDNTADQENAQENLSQESISIMAGRMEKYIRNLRNALIRIENKTYGIDRITGKLIPAARLRIVPHATLDVSTKNSLNEKR
ncbi:MAG: TraR/DksA family transcriptional regulator [Bacteroidales bacterium]|nr:TraR/DksA family transcriptional regulator [Bacteroidales bacterium]MBP5682256.1 TraR/DksA family transcriptional regulator [Bacteroidales bacterium]